MFEFAYPLVWLLLPLPAVVFFVSKKPSALSFKVRVPSHSMQGIEQQNHLPSGGWKLWYWLLIWLLLLASAAQPRWLGPPMSIPNEGREMIIAVDLSGSMKMEDMVISGDRVDRLRMIKQVVSDFITRRVGDRLGLILFADTAYVQAPMTFDRTTVRTLLNEAEIGLVGEKTAIGDAIGLAVKRFSERERSNRVLVLLTDGQNTSGNITPEQALELAIENQVTIYPIGVGADRLELQNFFGSRVINPSQDLDETLLNELAVQTGGTYFRARDTQQLETIYGVLDQLEPIAGEAQELRPMNALFYLPLAVAFALATLYQLVLLPSQRRPSQRRQRHGAKQKRESVND